MGSTFLQLTNRVLRRLQEVELTEATFSDTRGIHTAAKDAVLDTIREINASVPTLNYMAYQHSMDLTQGVSEYAWPEGWVQADWQSFQIQKDDTLGIKSQTLKVINREQWYRYLKDLDYDSEDEGREMPQFVFETHGTGFGVSPRPNEDYPIQFRYWKKADDLSDHDDETTIDNEYDWVIVNGALSIMYLIRDNQTRSDLCKDRYKTGLRYMMTNLNEQPPHMTDTRVPTRSYGSGRMWIGN